MSDAGWVGLPWIGSSTWAYPVLEICHIVGIGLLLGSLLLLELRVWGAAPGLSVEALAQLALRVSAAGYGLALASGLLMFAAHPNDMLSNRAFLIKMGLMLLAGLNALQFHARGGLQRLDRTARLQTALSLGLWLGVIICGRWIAYL